MHKQLRGHQSGSFRQAHGHDALAAAALHAELGNVGALAVTLLGDGEHLLVFLDARNRDDLVVFRQIEALDAHGVAAHRADIRLLETNSLTLARRQHQLVVVARQLHADQLVVLAQHDGN